MSKEMVTKSFIITVWLPKSQAWVQTYGPFPKKKEAKAAVASLREEYPNAKFKIVRTVVKTKVVG